MRDHTVGTPKYIVPLAHRRTPAESACRCEPGSIRHASAEHAQHQAVHVEQRQPVHEGVGRRPLPRVGQTIEVGSDRPPRQHDALGKARRAGGVHDQRRRRRRRAPCRTTRTHRSPRTCGSVTSGHCGSPMVAVAPESRSMCSRSMGPASAGIGTTGTPAISPATTPTTVSSVGVARMRHGGHAGETLGDGAGSPAQLGPRHGVAGNRHCVDRDRRAGAFKRGQEHASRRTNPNDDLAEEVGLLHPFEGGMDLLDRIDRIDHRDGGRQLP